MNTKTVASTIAQEMGTSPNTILHFYVLLVSGEKKVCAIRYPNGQFSLADLPPWTQQVGQEHRTVKHVAEEIATSFNGIEALEDSRLIVRSANLDTSRNEITIVWACRIGSQPDLPNPFQWMDSGSIKRANFCGDLLNDEGAELVRSGFAKFMEDAQGWRRAWTAVKKIFRRKESLFGEQEDTKTIVCFGLQESPPADFDPDQLGDIAERLSIPPFDETSFGAQHKARKSTV
ncbi:hypothetical protein PRZ48_005338 [Zasmidium cellare]|uniref:Nudix hydrolase domain-containing protein n=1 Tax=Zasmidium cellare TaxID=395010 RepID=A0ABR0ES50_ZASCE|nr:hypothetical protein PRZ48_005338 [Zasmidium cellare]